MGLKINVIPIKIPAGLFVYSNEQILKFILKGKGTRNPKQFLKRKIKEDPCVPILTLII